MGSQRYRGFSRPESECYMIGFVVLVFVPSERARRFEGLALVELCPN